MTNPGWFGDYVDYLIEHYSPARAVHHLRWIGQAINTAQSARPDIVAVALVDRSNAFDEFIFSAALGFAHDPESSRAAHRRRSRIAAIPPGFPEAAQRFCDAMVRRQGRASRLGVRSDRNRTIESRLATIRDFAMFTQTRRPHVDRLELVAVVDVEAFLATCHGHGAATQLAYLRQFFTWCRRHRLVLTDPTSGLWRDSKPVFAGPVLTVEDQRRLFTRWLQPAEGVHPYEPVVGLLAMLHALSRGDIVNLRIGNFGAGGLVVDGRPEPVPIDPATNDALDRAISHRGTFNTTNPHLIVNKDHARTRRGADGGYLSGLMASGPKVTLRALRSTRLSSLVGELDPITVSTALGIDAAAAICYHSIHDLTADDEQFTTEATRDSPV